MLKIQKAAKRIFISTRKIFIHGFIIMATLIIIQLLLDVYQNPFLLYMPPLGFAFFMLVSYGIQPLIVGVLNVIVLHRLYGFEGWQVGFWLNGLFLLLTFSTINLLLLQTIIHLPSSPYIAVAEIPVLSYPFGYLGKFSNGGSQKAKLQ